MVTIRHERPADVAAREALLDLSYGPVRFTKASERLRERRLPELSLVAADGRRIVGTVRLWPVAAGPRRPALLLGPLAVDPDCRNRGIGSALVRRALDEAARRGAGAVLLVGDAPYYGRFGFSSEKTGALRLPGPYERHRLLACELAAGALDGAQGLISARGRSEAKPDLAKLVAGLVRGDPIASPRADEPGSGRVPGARTIESPRWPLASLASAARAA
jgi:predicted N-acetyltransferase YhbS